MMPHERMGGVLVSLSKASEPICGKITVCNAWPMRRQAYGYFPNPQSTATAS